jgi:propanediol dehydratase small subunit
MALIEAALDYIAESAVAPRGFFAMLIDPATLKCLHRISRASGQANMATRYERAAA